MCVQCLVVCAVSCSTNYVCAHSAVSGGARHVRAQCLVVCAVSCGTNCAHARMCSIWWYTVCVCKVYIITMCVRVFCGGGCAVSGDARYVCSVQGLEADPV